VTDVVTGEAVVLEVPCARYPSRMIALIIDIAIQVVLLTGLFLVAGASGARLNAATAAAVGVTAIVLIIVGYPATFETLARGKSLGKMALGLRVVSDDGGPERFRQALVRALASVIEIWLLAGAPALISSLLSSRGKRLGDLFAGTFVIQERLPRRPELPASLAVVPGPLAGWAQHLELSGLTDQAAEAASSYLRRFYELTPAARDELGRRIAATVAAQITPDPPAGTPPAELLAAVLAVRRARETSRLAAERQRWQARAAVAEAAEGTASQPGTSQPGATQPGASQPGAIQPGSSRAEADAPDSGQFAPPV
jgi:uncharacterized RDD family membrane protein YckC